MKPRYRVTAGMRMPMGFAPAALESALRYIPADDDIVVASYPKSGTTWLQYIVYMLVRGHPIGDEETLSGLFPHLEESGLEALAAVPRPRLIKTHLQRELLTWSQAARYLVILRNPFDCVVSFFHHTRGFPRHYDFASGTFADFFENFLAGEVDFGDYFDHLVSWYAVSGRANVMLLTYESLRRDTQRTIGRIAGFLGTGVAAAARDRLDEIVSETSLASMQRNQSRWSSRRPEWAPPFVRSGSVGGWQDQFTPGQTAALLAKFDRRLGEAGIASPWTEEIDEARAYARRHS